MTDYELARWASIYEAINIIADDAEELGIKFEKVRLKQKPISDYININSALIYDKLKGKIKYASKE